VRQRRSIIPGLIESELFGYRKGLFELAEGGTIFLDEIGEMPVRLQPKLLAVLEDKEVRRIGAESAKKVTVRVIAATGSDLETSLGKSFRKDLYCRLSVIRIHIPPLRERKEDIPDLCRQLLKEISGGRELSLSDEEIALLSAYDWPGNIRELKNVLERAVIMQPEDLRPSSLLGRTAAACVSSETENKGNTIATLEEVERDHIERSLGR
jgi:transcriptional regulator with PAS, ATPase and Fis domain